MTGYISEYNSRQEKRTTPRFRSDKKEKAVDDVEVDDVTEAGDATKSDGIIQSEEIKVE